MELNELYQSFSIFLYIGIFTECFFWRTREYLEYEKAHWVEKTLVPGLQEKGENHRGIKGPVVNCFSELAPAFLETST